MPSKCSLYSQHKILILPLNYIIWGNALQELKIIFRATISDCQTTILNLDFVLQAQEPGATVQPIPGGRVQVSRGIHSARPDSGPSLLQRRQVGGRGTSLHSHKYKPNSLSFNIMHYVYVTWSTHCFGRYYSTQ
jgi:hypothetical protein